MDFLNKIASLTPMQALKGAGLILLAIIGLVFSLQLVGTSVKTLVSQNSNGTSGSFTVGMPGFGGGVAYEGDYEKSESSVDMPMGVPTLSYRNAVGIMPPVSPSPTGDDAEEFEVTAYSATIETRQLQETCDTVSALKAKDYVIFESANEYDRGCNFTFKVKHANVEEVLAVLESLDPKELSENTYTIKRQIDDFTNEVEVLEKKRASIDETLKSAVDAYNEITRLATNTQNAEALAQIIDSKIRIIERLTQERININEQLDRLSRAKEDQLDQLEYTTFGVNVYESKFVDGEQLVDSWKAAIQNFVRDLNGAVQDLTVNLLLLFVLLIQWAIYALILLVIAKYAWRIGRWIWFR